MPKVLPVVCKYLIPGIVAWAFYFYGFAQSIQNKRIWAELIRVEKDTSISLQQKLDQVTNLKKDFDNGNLGLDSVYARMLHKIGLYTYLINDQIATSDAILSTIAAVRINLSESKNSNPAYCIISYSNLAIYYASLRMYGMAALYYDSAIIMKKQYTIPENPLINLVSDKAQMLIRTGDYEKAIDEFNKVILLAKADNDTLMLQSSLNQRAQSYLLQGKLESALKDIYLANDISNRTEFNSETINSLIIKARVMAAKKDFSIALSLFKAAIKQRLLTSDYNQIADDYTDLGNFYLNDLHDYEEAKNCYLKNIRYALDTQDSERLAKGHTNLEQCSFKQQQYKEAEFYCVESLKDLKVNATSNIFINPAATRLSAVGNKELILVILGNKTELLLKQFSLTGDTNYLSACLQTALLMDTMITGIRHEQSGEQSKLYWRNHTREFYTHSMEACYLANDARLSFYFMEKSRAVLLNDKLNELGAAAHLPQEEAIKERELQISVITEQQKLAAIESNKNEYEIQQTRVAEVKETLEHFIKLLERKYPAYYQYKYADEVPGLPQIQKYLQQNSQSFVHYFINDTIAFILGIAPSNTKLIRLTKDKFNSVQLLNFLQLCSDQQALNNDYASFAFSSHSLYKLLFQPLNITKGRVVICPDNFMIPFEALCTDNAGNNFLVKDCSFSYVYSARNLMKEYNIGQAKEDFIGFAPVSFKAYKRIADLKESAEALKQSAGYYNNTTLLTNKHATRNNFLSAVSGYTVVNVFSHARADTTENEPVLYMYDSIILLSELQLLHQPATRLAVLSACQTNVGKNATGEGVISLARGFATAGIPAVAATLWKADEQTIYTISAKFHEYLSKGLPKDEALQKAKLYFMHNNGKVKQLPYYWANMILAGSGEPIKIKDNNHSVWWVAGSVIVIAILLLIVLKSKKRIV